MEEELRWDCSFSIYCSKHNEGGLCLGGNANKNKVWLEEELINFHNQFCLYLFILILKPVWYCMSVAVIACRHG